MVARVIALACAWLGAWLILPFAGIEPLVLRFASCWMERHARDCERLTLPGDMLRMEGDEVGRVQQTGCR